MFPTVKGAMLSPSTAAKAVHRLWNHFREELPAINIPELTFTASRKLHVTIVSASTFVNLMPC